MPHLSDNDHEYLLRMAAATVNSVDYERFGTESEDEITDDIHPDVFSDALDMERFEPYEAAEISDALYEGICLRFASRYSELATEGLIG